MCDEIIKAYSESKVFFINDRIDVIIAIRKIVSTILIGEVSLVNSALIATIVSELGTNIVKYAGKGSITLSMNIEQDSIDIQILAEDRGPGISNLPMAMKDHFSTNKTLGLGLPGVKRIADTFNVQSSANKGTCVFASKRIKK